MALLDTSVQQSTVVEEGLSLVRLNCALRSYLSCFGINWYVEMDMDRFFDCILIGLDRKLFLLLLAI